MPFFQELVLGNFSERPGLIRFENVTMQYRGGQAILEDASFHLAPGSFHFLTGDSGAGKSTLLRLIYLALRPMVGRIEVFGRDARGLRRREIPDVRRRIGVVYQNFRLIEHLSAMDNVALPLRIAGAREQLIREHVPELLEWVGLSGHLDALPRTLSGGQQQRVAIARAVIARPPLLLADEPTGNVDDEIAMRLLYLFEELHKMGTTVLVATHNQALVDRFNHPSLHLSAGLLGAVAPKGGTQSLTAARSSRPAARSRPTRKPGSA
ncbi:MAG: cell division ATP-binding protein FtsE [Rhodospirillaceae bacterium]|jgi:cell division transport system ATP-binding protein|nr:cell division ATP-binding protein FtsE [Rhodospirillaceae bacterium]MBT6137870.1 cell division ATP-binding protein FtsE [Rhodospirillaceae bacterium]